MIPEQQHCANKITILQTLYCSLGCMVLGIFGPESSMHYISKTFDADTEFVMLLLTKVKRNSCLVSGVFKQSSNRELII